MRWNKPNLRHSLHSLLGRDAPASTGWVRDQRLEEVRQTMLRHMAGLEGGEAVRITMRLRYAIDAEALWYLRTDLRSALAAAHGASLADEALQQITPLFHGLLPHALGGNGGQAARRFGT
jgi:hypothetical protein